MKTHTFTEAFGKRTKDTEGCGMPGTIASLLTTDEDGKPAWHQLWMDATKREAMKRALGEESLQFYLQVSGHTSCGRTSGRVCYIPRPAVEALCPRSSRRWTPPGGYDWATMWHVRERQWPSACSSTPG